MAQQLKVTRTFIPPPPLTIDANYYLNKFDSGKLIRVNSTAIVESFLPQVESNAGLSYKFMQVNTGAIYLEAPTNSIFFTGAVNASNKVRSVGSGVNMGIMVEAVCDGTNWNVWATQTPANVGALTQRW